MDPGGSRRREYAAYAIMSVVETTIFAVECHSKWPLERVLDVYWKINTTGTKMSVEEIEAGVRRSMIKANREEQGSS